METETKKYNGWTNYETWNVKLWMDNDEGSYHYWQEATQEAFDQANQLKEDGELEAYFTVKEKAALILSDQIKEVHEENTPTVTGVYADLLNAALSEVDWHEIATSLLDELEEE
jgi:hypothetical protein